MRHGAVILEVDGFFTQAAVPARKTAMSTRCVGTAKENSGKQRGTYCSDAQERHPHHGTAP